MNRIVPGYFLASLRVFLTSANASFHAIFLLPLTTLWSLQNRNKGIEKSRKSRAVGTKVETRPPCVVNGTSPRRKLTTLLGTAPMIGICPVKNGNVRITPVIEPTYHNAAQIPYNSLR